MAKAKRTIENWCRYVLNRQFTDPSGWELQNMLIVSRLMIDAALQREESRGVHFRTDFPLRNDRDWLNRTLVRWGRDEGEPTFSYEPTGILDLPPGHEFTAEVADMAQLSRVMDRLAQIPGLGLGKAERARAAARTKRGYGEHPSTGF